jgi:hypothetical protein
MLILFECGVQICVRTENVKKIDRLSGSSVAEEHKKEGEFKADQVERTGGAGKCMDKRQHV